MEQFPDIAKDPIYLALEQQISDRQRLHSRLKVARGVSREIALEIEKAKPGFLTERRPIQMFTVQPSRTHYGVAMEALSGGVMAAIAAGVLALLGLLYAMFSGESSSGSGGGGGGGGGSAPAIKKTIEKVEKAQEKAEVVAEATKELLDTKLPREVENRLADIFVNHMSLFEYQLLVENGPGYGFSKALDELEEEIVGSCVDVMGMLGKLNVALQEVESKGVEQFEKTCNELKEAYSRGWPVKQSHKKLRVWLNEVNAGISESIGGKPYVRNAFDVRKAFKNIDKWVDQLAKGRATLDEDLKKSEDMASQIETLQGSADKMKAMQFDDSGSEEGNRLMRLYKEVSVGALQYATNMAYMESIRVKVIKHLIHIGDNQTKIFQEVKKLIKEQVKGDDIEEFEPLFAALEKATHVNKASNN